MGQLCGWKTARTTWTVTLQVSGTHLSTGHQPLNHGRDNPQPKWCSISVASYKASLQLASVRKPCQELESWVQQRGCPLMCQCPEHGTNPERNGYLSWFPGMSVPVTEVDLDPTQLRPDHLGVPPLLYTSPMGVGRTGHYRPQRWN